ncbi:MAG: dienelactone hydrolase family protein [Rudaea sp.]
MGTQIQVATSRTQCIGAYVAHPPGQPRGGIVVVQEIFGVNAWVRGVVDRFAAHGYSAIAPAFFDHVEAGVELDYGKAGFERGRSLVGEIGFERALEDVAAAAQSIASSGRIGVVGYCWGGTIALLAAIRLALPAVSYYGGRNVQFLDEPLAAPVQFHFGERDASIPAAAIERHRESYALAIAAGCAEVFAYADAGHAFDRDVDTGHFARAASASARARTLAFLDRYLGAAGASTSA